MSSTNKTTYYELSQYIGADKPTYLGDYNADMGKIDAGIHTAKNTADTNTTNIGDLTSLTTESKSTLVGAINEVDSHADTNAGNISSLGITVASNTSHIGEVANLDTTNKSNLVGAINEIFEYLSLSDNRALTSPVITDTSGNVMTGASVTSNTLRVALNSSGTYGKIYGKIDLEGVTAFPKVKFINTGIKGVTEAFTIDCAGIVLSNTGSSIVRGISVEIAPAGSGETSASITLVFGIWDAVVKGLLFPCIYYFTDFGDVPVNS